MNEKPSAGDRSRSDPLSVRIDRKAFRMADGTVLEVLQGVEFELPHGSFTCLTGPSGCGKTSTLRILLGLDHDFEGRVDERFAGSRLAAVFQEPRLLPWRTVEQNIRLVLPDGAADRVEPLLAEVGLADAAGSYPAELSLGMARRAALARAFSIDPEILILDEPFVSLDETTANRLRELLLALWRRRPTTVLMVTHNLREAVALAGRLIVMGPRPARVLATAEVPDGSGRGKVNGRFLAELAGRFPGILAPLE